jgi:ATP-dependent 26S proteasome regulatory subunit
LADQLKGATGADIERICQNAIKSVILKGEKVLKLEDLEAAIAHHHDRMEVVTRSQNSQEFVTGDANGEL